MNKKDVIKWYIILYPVCDIIYTLSIIWGLNINFGQIIRGIGIILFFSCIKKQRDFLKILLVMLVVIISFVYNAQNGPSSSVMSDFANVLKILNNFVLLYAFIELYKSKITFEEISNWLIRSSYIVIVSILLSYLGIGLNSYSDSGREGVKGLFTIQSTITLYLLLIFPLYYYKYRKIYNIRIILYIIALFSIGSKTGVFGTILEYVSIIFIDLKTNRAGKSMRKKQFIQYIVVFVGSIPFGLIYMRNYIMYLLNLYNTKAYYYSLEAFLLSNRNDQLIWTENALNIYNGGDKNIIGDFLGYSYSGVANLVKNTGHKIGAIERDFHGLYYYYGFILLMIIIFLIVYTYRKILFLNIQNKFCNIDQLLVFLIVSVGVIYSFLGGHLLYEAMNQIPFWAIVSYGVSSYSRRGENKNEYRHCDISQSI